MDFAFLVARSALEVAFPRAMAEGPNKNRNFNACSVEGNSGMDGGHPAAFSCARREAS
jgi:hypothetical protein